MKDLVYILMKNNTIVKRKIKNPNRRFKVLYEVDGEVKEFYYNYKREKTFILPALFSKRVSFYEHGKQEPLSPEFKTDALELEEVSDILNTGLFKSLIDSAKPKMALGDTATILGLAGIGAIVIIVLVSKFLG